MEERLVIYGEFAILTALLLHEDYRPGAPGSRSRDHPARARPGQLPPGGHPGPQPSSLPSLRPTSSGLTSVSTGRAFLRGRAAACEGGKLTEVSPQNSLQRGFLCRSFKAGLRLKKKKKNKQANTPPPPPRRAHSPETYSLKNAPFFQGQEHSVDTCLGVRAAYT